jgi:Tol biopolymer transport system component
VLVSLQPLSLVERTNALALTVERLNPTDGKDQLWVRDLDSLAARVLTGTDGASDPFWSPDSRAIACDG